MEKFFKLKENGTNVSTEIMAGITTFMTMAYILAVNPNILSASGMDRGAVFTATALSAFIATCLMALLSNYPFVLAPGMGLNAYFAYTVVLGMGYTWQAALAAVFVEGIIFIVLSLTNVREAIFNAIPMNLKHAVSVGIGLFIAFIGLQNAKIVVNNDSTLLGLFSFKGSVQAGTFNYEGITVLLALIGILITAIFLAIPSFATAPALIMVGFLMLTSITKIDFSDYTEAIPCFIAIIAMPFMYSISEGIAMGVISYVVLNVATGKAKEKKISILMYVLAVLFILKYVVL